MKLFLVAGLCLGVLFCGSISAQVTQRVSVGPAGLQGNGGSTGPSISADGRYVAFWSFASNWVAGDINNPDVFVRDRQSGTTERVSISSTGAPGNGWSDFPSISADGRYVAFGSDGTNLVAGDTNGASDTFVRDRQSGTTARVSVSSAGAQGNGDSFSGAPISADGRYVAFVSAATNLIVGDTNGAWDIFVRDRQSGTTERVSVDSIGSEANDHSYAPSISPDGRYVAFTSWAQDLIAVDTNGTEDVFVRDRQSGTTERVSVDSAGIEGNGDSEDPSISADGRYVAFQSFTSNLVAGDTNGSGDVFIRDRDATGFTSLCDPGESGVILCPCSNPPAGSGRGCNNFGAGPVDSGTLTASGVAYLSMDTVLLTATGENNTSLTVFWTGTTLIAPPGVVHGAGVRCVSGLKRLYTGTASGGTISRPAMGDPPVSTVGGPINAGETRYYFTIYRDPQAASPCGNTSSTVNLTNAGSITWNL